MSSPPKDSTNTLQGVLWSHQETLSLIQTYQEKWYSLNRGQLKASQWDEVAVIVAVRCRFDYEQTRSAVQCRHKMEKLRRRYRDEKRRVSAGSACFWPYYDLMDSLGSGSTPIAVKPLSLIENPNLKIPNYGIKQHTGSEIKASYKPSKEIEEEEEIAFADRNRSPKILDYTANRYPSNGIKANCKLSKDYEEEEELGFANRNPKTHHNCSGEEYRGNEIKEIRKVGSSRGIKRKEVEAKEEEVGIAKEIRGFAGKMMRVERRRLQMVRETERWRMEVEKKRIEMILGFERKIVALIESGFGSL